MKKLLIITLIVFQSCTPDEPGTLTKVEQISFTQTELYNEVEVSKEDYTSLLHNTNEIYIKRAAENFENVKMGSYNLHRQIDEEGIEHYYFRMISLTPMIELGDELWVKI